MSATAREVALDLAANYGIPVFPCRADKSPATPRGFKDATTNVEQIDHWFENGALVGVPTGAISGLAVVDIDPAGENWYAEHAVELKAGCVNRTRRGYHLVYKATVPVSCSAGAIAPGVDVRGDGGYVIWWPAMGLSQTGSLDDLTAFPEWILPRARQPKVASEGSEKIQEGGRNDHLSRLAFKLRKAGLDVAEIEAALLVANTSRCEPPLADDEVRAIAKGKAKIEPDDEPEEPIGPLFISADTLRESSFATPAPIIEGLLLPGATLVHGPAKKGKSWFLLQMGLAIDSGESFLGRKVARRDCLYVGAEDTNARFKSRLERMFAFGSLKFMNREGLEAFSRRLHLALGEEPVTAQIAVEKLWEAAGRPSVVILDTQEVFEIIVGIAHGKPGDAVTRRDYRATSSYDGLALKLGICIVLVGHWGELKNIQKATVNPHECLNTTKARIAGVTTSITLGPLPNQQPGEAASDMQLSIRSRDAQGGDQFLWLKQDSITGTYTCLGTVNDVLVTEAQVKLFETLLDFRKENGGDAWAQAADLAEMLDCTPQNVKQMVGRVRKAAKAQGRKPMYQGFELESKPNKGYRLK